MASKKRPHAERREAEANLKNKVGYPRQDLWRKATCCLWNAPKGYHGTGWMSSEFAFFPENENKPNQMLPGNQILKSPELLEKAKFTDNKSPVKARYSAEEDPFEEAMEQMSFGKGEGYASADGRAQVEGGEKRKAPAETVEKSDLRQRTDQMIAESYQALPPLQNAAGQTIMKVKHTPLTAEPGTITQLVVREGSVNRNDYGLDGRQYKQISNHNHGNPKQHPFGEQGEHAHDHRYDVDGKLVRGEARELSEEEKSENGDVL